MRRRLAACDSLASRLQALRQDRREMFMRAMTKAALLAGVVCFSLAGPALAGDPVVYNGYKVPKDSLGRPDLTGVWDAATMTGLQRLPGFGNRIVMTPAEVAAIEDPAAAFRKKAAEKTDQSIVDIKKLPADGSGNYNAGFLDPGTTIMRVHGEPRNSILTTPDGYVPVDLKGHMLPRPQPVKGYAGSNIPQPGSEDGQDRPGMSDNPESRGLSERCVLGFSNGLAILPSLYNSNYSIQQSRDTVAIESEMIHSVRVVRLNAKHRTDGVKQWDGDPIGWYEGNTLVVETVGYDPRTPMYGASDQVKVTERFTRVSPTRLYYSFTIEDPKTWAKPWGGEEEFTTSKGIYEYACHEGNYGLEAILAGARADDAKAKQATASLGK
jgi:hypothetical protein